MFNAAKFGPVALSYHSADGGTVIGIWAVKRIAHQRTCGRSGPHLRKIAYIDAAILGIGSRAAPTDHRHETDSRDKNRGLCSENGHMPPPRTQILCQLHIIFYGSVQKCGVVHTGKIYFTQAAREISHDGRRSKVARTRRGDYRDTHIFGDCKHAVAVQSVLLVMVFARV